MPYRFSDYTDNLNRTLGLLHEAQAELRRINGHLEKVARDAEARGVWVELANLRANSPEYVQAENKVAQLEHARVACLEQLNSAEVQALREREEAAIHQLALGTARVEVLKSKARESWLNHGQDPAGFESAWTFQLKPEVLRRAVLDDIFGPDESKLKDGEVL